MAMLTVLHIVAAILLITLVLVQDSKGAMGGSFGGGSSSQSILGPTGAPSFLYKATKWVVVVFALTSLLLTKLSAEKSSSVFDGTPGATAPVTAPVTAPATTDAAAPATTPAPTATPTAAPVPATK